MKTKTQKHAVKNCGIFKIYPNNKTDTLNGGKMTNGVMFMQVHAGECKLKHKGKPVEIHLGSGLDGSTILLCNNRYAKISLKLFISAAIEAGFLDDKINFTETE